MGVIAIVAIYCNCRGSDGKKQETTGEAVDEEKPSKVEDAVAVHKSASMSEFMEDGFDFAVREEGGLVTGGLAHVATNQAQVWSAR